MIVKTDDYLSLALAVGIAFMSAGLTVAQEAQPTPTPQPTPSSQPPPATRTVNLSAIFVDRGNQSLDDIQKDEIRLFENDVPQAIASFSKKEKPVDYGIAIDTSGSLRSIFPLLLAAVRVFLENHKPDDQCFIERFVSSDKIENVQEFTSDKAALLKWVSTLYIEGGQSAVIDALYVAVQHISKRPLSADRRRALVVFTDGEDRASYYSKDQLMQLLRTTEVPLFIVGLVSDLDSQTTFTRPSAQQKARDLLKAIAHESGGRIFFPSNKKELSEALGEIFHDIHIQYEISYQSTDASPNNFHPLRLEVMDSPSREKVKVINRPGYYVTPPEPESKDKKKKAKKP